MLGTEKIAFTDITTLTVDSDIPNGLRVLLPAGADRAAVRAAIKKAQPDLACRDADVGGGAAVDCVMTAQQVRERRDFAITSNITTLRNRVNELGVSEPIVQRQGLDRIVVQLPGVQNSAEVKDILGKVATLEYRLVDPRPMPAQRPRAGGREALRPRSKRRSSARSCSSATSSSPATSSRTPRRPPARTARRSTSRSTARGGDEMLKTTRANLGKPMAVVFIEQRRETVDVDGKPVDAQHQGREGHQRRHHPGRVRQPLPDHRPHA